MRDALTRCLFPLPSSLEERLGESGQARCSDLCQLFQVSREISGMTTLDFSFDDLRLDHSLGPETSLDLFSISHVKLPSG